MLFLTAVVFSLQPYLGVSSGELNWNIASDIDASTTPNILSELDFDVSKILHGGLKLKLESELFWPDYLLFIETNTNYGFVADGDSTDSDYFGDNRTLLYSRSSSDVAGDDVNAIEGGIGVQKSISTVVDLSASFGGYHSEQNINFQKGTQLFADPSVFFPVSLEDLSENLQQNLDSDYITKWSGYWWATKIQFHLQSWEFSFRYKSSQGDYYGEGRWNLRTDGFDAFQQPKSFTHRADSDGKELTASIAYHFTKRLLMNLEWVDVQLEAEDGLSVTYFANGTFRRSIFNSASWNSSQLFLGLEYKF